jgi:predicted NBD/HSP70 family sugar kinase
MRLSELKNIELEIYRIVYIQGEVLRSDVANHINSLSISSLYRILDQLVQKGYLIESFGQVKTNGRPPKLYRINPKFVCAIGLCITWDSIRLSLVDIGGNLIAKETLGSATLLSPNEALEIISTTINKWVNKYECSDSLLGIGVSAFGPIMKDLGILSHGHHKPSQLWDYVPIKDLLEASTGIPVVVDNLVDAYMLNELALKPDLLEKRVAYFLLDMGIGSAFHPIPTQLSITDTSSQLGHMVIDLHGDECVCGKRGCLETFASAQSILRRVCENQAISLESADEVYAALESYIQGPDYDPLDPKVDEIVTAFVAAIANFIQMMEPEIVMLGGRTVKSLARLIEQVVVRLKEMKNHHLFSPKLKVEFANTSEEALMRGSASIVFRRELGVII